MRLDDEGTLEQIRRTHDDLGLVIDPHTAVGVFGAGKFADGKVPMVVMETADPAKFPDAVESAIGVRPELPSFLSELLGRQEYFETSPADLSAVAQHLAAVQHS